MITLTQMVLTSCMLAAPAVSSQDLPDISSVDKELSIPKTSAGAPAAGARVRETTPGWDAEEVHHMLWLPEDWEPEVTYPVIFEYPGNGGYSDDFDGTPENSGLGYGLTAGRGYIWVCLPFVQVKEGKRSIAEAGRNSSQLRRASGGEGGGKLLWASPWRSFP